MNGLSGRTVVVTGGASGIGLAVCQRAIEEGCAVALVDANIELAEKEAAALRERGGKCQALKIDVTNFDIVREGIQQIIKDFGQVDVLVNCVGWNTHSFFAEQDSDFWRKVVDINLMAQIYMCHAVLEDMSSRKSGSIVTVASDAGRVGSMGEVVYSAAKGGVISFTKALARETTRYGIRVNCISPGPTDTPFLRKVTEEQPKILEQMTRIIPMKRIGDPAELASAIMFLASDEASYITGQVLSVSGGLTMAG